MKKRINQVKFCVVLILTISTFFIVSSCDKNEVDTQAELSEENESNAEDDNEVQLAEENESNTENDNEVEFQDDIGNDVKVELPTGNNDVLVWSEEFSLAGSPSVNNWAHDIGAGGWGNNESQYYTNSTDNAYVQGGVLKIVAKKELYLGSEYTSARLSTKNKYSFTYGKVEVRAKLPKELGSWPAIWTLGANLEVVGWPACGSINIMEHSGNNLGVIFSSIHNSSGYGNTPYIISKDLTEDITTEFHTYAINWTKDKIEFLVDDVILYIYAPIVKNSENWPFDKDQVIVLNLAIGGTLGGIIDSEFTSSTMEIDYIRVYQ